jgi:alpha-amylase/alpha-mannosidase (GH57 family)
MERFICIHGHFYQPPRENPWLEFVEVQDSAFPYHDWNERIMAECYAPNSASRLLDGSGCITEIVSNYEKISFNFGATLLLWMENSVPGLYAAIQNADARSVELRSGHGNAMAQIYNHMIMPLASSRDKRTQVRWGIADFEYRFKRLPEGMWLSETAVDLETLDLLAEYGIKYTLLAPRQADKIKKIGTEKWTDVSGGRIDPTRPYLCKLPSGRQIVLFFYDGPISQAVAFEKLLGSGEHFANRLKSGFSDLRTWKQLLHIATDGESYGHHHKFGDMALAYALNYIEDKGIAKLTNYGEFLAENPPEYEVQIYENSSWSCIHGVERWRSNCGCNSGGYPSWNQEWRKPLRAALDWLRDAITSLFEAKAKDYLADPWDARDDYIRVVLKRSEDTIQAFLARHARRELTQEEKTKVLEMMEMQRHAMLMYTSCGWFFDELSGIETVQVIFYAGRAVQLAEKLFGMELQKSFEERLSRAKSNIPAQRDGAHIYERLVKPTMVDLKKVAAHFAISSFISEYGETANIFSYKVRKEDYHGLQAGDARLNVGKIKITSSITLDSADFSFSALHLGGHIFNAGVRNFREEIYGPMKNEIIATFQKGDIAEMIRYMDRQFGMSTYSLMDLFRDEQRKILNIAFAVTSEDFEHAYRHLYEDHRTLMSFMKDAGMPIPRGFLAAVEFTLVADMKTLFLQEKIDGEKIKRVIDESKRWNIPIDSGLEFMVRRKGEEMIVKIRENPQDNAWLANFLFYLELLRSLPVDLNYWLMQNVYFEIAVEDYKDVQDHAALGSDPSKTWIDSFTKVGELLSFNMQAILRQLEEKKAVA